MKSTRREFAAMVGAAVASPGLWGRAVAEFEQTGEVSQDTALALLDAQGERGIFAEPAHLDELRAALARKIRDHKMIRSVEIPGDIEPLLGFRR